MAPEIVNSNEKDVLNMEAKKYIFYSIIVLSVFMMQGCSKKKDLKSLTPRQVAELYVDLENDYDTELLRQIIYFPPGTSEEEIRKRIGPSSPSKDAKGGARILRAAGFSVTTKYEKILTEDTAEVGVVMKMGIGPLSKRKPFDQLIMKKDNGIWKAHYYRRSLTKEQLIDTIREDPQSAWAYYHLGMETLSDNPYRAYKYFNKYYELKPKGFFVDSELLRDVEFHRNPQKMEQMLLENIQKTPENAKGRAIDYMRLSQLFTEHEDFEKARTYLGKAENIQKVKFSRTTSEKLKKAWQELELKKSGKYTDILTELEQNNL
jgi:hypothetical protein